jgi:hypothetical protein
MERLRRLTRRIRPALPALTWISAVVLATALGLAAVGLVGDAARGRGPLGHAVTRADAPQSGSSSTTGDAASPADDSDRVVRRSISRDFGTFLVSCEGAYAHGIAATPANDGGWRVVRFEPGPDDDVEAVFASLDEVVEVEVFCNRGRPAVAELDRSRVPDPDDSD